MWTIYKKKTFESAHQLPGHPKCGKLHGHSYICEVWIKSDKLSDPYKFVVDFSDISKIVNELDHSNKIINDSCEILARIICEKIRELTPKEAEGSIKVRLWETSTSYGEYKVKL